MTIAAQPNTACLACGAREWQPVEELTSAQIVDGWRREDIAVGAGAVTELRARDLSAALPPQIRWDRCAQCGLEVASPPVLWSSHTYPSDQSYPVRWEFLRCLDELGSQPRTVLEVGCGTGEFLALAESRGHRAIGIDFSPTAVAAARGKGLDAFEGGLADLPRFLGDGPVPRFDAVVLFQVIEHLTEPGALVTALRRWLVPGGRLFLSCPGPRRFTRLIREQQTGTSDFWDHPPHHVLRWNLAALRDFFERQGWRVLAAEEEPLSLVAAGSHVGIARSIHRRLFKHPLGRRATIARAWLDLMTAPSTRRAGMSLYFSATIPS
jgi:SAM-dependent methyltransferase